MPAPRLALVVALSVAAATAAGLMVRAEQSGTGPAPDDALPTITPPPIATQGPPTPPPEAEPPASSNETSAGGEPQPSAKPQAKPQAAAPPAPPAPVMPVRSPGAILQALDKVTAETIRFAAPVGQRIRYKNLVFTVKACETTGLSAPAPQASAYLTIESKPLAVQGGGAPPAKEVYHGWMFASSPGLHPLEHPVYDAWLIACMAAAPPV